MSTESKSLVRWNIDEVVIPTAATPQQIVELGRPQLSQRDMRSIVTALKNGSFEMVATFVWTKASTVLKKQIASLGMEFVGEMLNRPDISDESDPLKEIGDHEALALAEDLSIINSTQAMRLKHSLELVSHFTNLDPERAETEEMAQEEAMLLLKACVSSILSHPDFTVAIHFADFRKSLTERTLKADDQAVPSLFDAPYFFVRTTLSVLLSTVKTSKGAQQEHAIGNLLVLLPLLWHRLRQQEKWQVGQAYAEVNASGDRAASSGIKKALLTVKGFDFVPETLRSSTFSRTAARVLDAHFGYQNFENEKEPMETLASLGTAVPRPAFAKCMEATLAVWLGNQWGHSWSAEAAAHRVLESLRNEQWEYYISECLPRDRTVLDKLADSDRPIKRWIKLVTEFVLLDRAIKDASVERLISASAKPDASKVKLAATLLREKATA